MKLGMYLTLLMILSSTSAVARETPPDYKHVALVNILLAMDHSLTLNIPERRSEGAYEKYNKLIPKYPSKGDVNRYFLAASVVVNGLVYVLPDKWSDRFMTVVEVLEVGMVSNNLYVGLRFSLP